MPADVGPSVYTSVLLGEQAASKAAVRGSNPCARAGRCSTRVRRPTPHDEIPWSSGNDSWPTPRERWFESIRDHCLIFVMRLGRAAGVSLRVLRSLPEAQAGTAGSRRGVGRPRHPVTVEIVGSNPIEDAWRDRDRARYANGQSGEAQTFVVCGFDSHSCHLMGGRGSCRAGFDIEKRLSGSIALPGRNKTRRLALARLIGRNP